VNDSEKILSSDDDSQATIIIIHELMLMDTRIFHILYECPYNRLLLSLISYIDVLMLNGRIVSLKFDLRNQSKAIEMNKNFELKALPENIKCRINQLTQLSYSPPPPT
jgi:hypothetical protein